MRESILTEIAFMATGDFVFRCMVSSLHTGGGEALRIARVHSRRFLFITLPDSTTVSVLRKTFSCVQCRYLTDDSSGSLPPDIPVHQIISPQITHFRVLGMFADTANVREIVSSLNSRRLMTELSSQLDPATQLDIEFIRETEREDNASEPGSPDEVRGRERSKAQPLCHAPVGTNS